MISVSVGLVADLKASVKKDVGLVSSHRPRVKSMGIEQVIRA